MAQFNVTEIIAATHGKLIAGPLASRFRRITTNSRDVKKGDLFIAIVGRKYDAHDFIVAAVKKGAAGLIVSRNITAIVKNVAIIKVADTTLALGHLARFHRMRFSIPVIAITGSAGKTTTKEMIAAVLKNKYRVLKNVGTENNQFGVPLTLLKMKSSDEVAVLEVGTNAPGDIPWLASLVLPTIVVMTNIGESHLELLKTPANVFKEKFCLVKTLKKDGTVIINHDDRFLKTIASMVENKVCTFGIQSKVDFRASGIQVDRDHLEFQVAGEGRFHVQGTATANVYNALAAISCGRLLHIKSTLIRDSLKKFSLKSGRQSYLKVGKIIVIDDTYNANPVSFRSALQAISQQRCEGRRILVCADMLELGRQSQRYHKEMGECAVSAGINAIFSYGEFAKNIGMTAQKRNPRIDFWSSQAPEKLEQRMKDYLQPGDIVLVKGSRGMHTERFVEFIKNHYQGR